MCIRDRLEHADVALEDAALDLVPSTADQRIQDFFHLAKLIALSDSVRRRKDFASAFVSRTKLMTQSIMDYDEIRRELGLSLGRVVIERGDCLLYTSDAADDLLCVDLGGRRI